MDEQKMELRKLRDFSQNISDTFKFIKQELKPLLLCFLAICGVFVLAHGILSGIYNDNTFSEIFGSIYGGRLRTGGLGDMFNGLYFLVVFLSLFNWVLMNVVLAVYLKLYNTNNNISPDIDEVWKTSIKYIVPSFFYSIPYFVIVVAGTLCCFAPGIYFAVVFAPWAIITVIEDVSFGRGFSRCFELIRENFWNSFAIYVVVGIIYVVSSMLIASLVGGVTGIASYLSTNDIDKTAAIVGGIFEIFEYVFYIILFISVALNYFNLREQADGDGLLRRIETLGSNNSNQPEEQY